MGELVLHVGPLGHGQAIKLINNAVAAANASTVAQALIAGAGAGVDLGALTTIMAAGSGASTMLTLKAGPMRAHDYTTLFKLEHMLKDVRLCLEEAETDGVPFPAAAAVEQWPASACSEIKAALKTNTRQAVRKTLRVIFRFMIILPFCYLGSRI